MRPLFGTYSPLGEDGMGKKKSKNRETGVSLPVHFSFAGLVSSVFFQHFAIRYQVIASIHITLAGCASVCFKGEREGRGRRS